MQEIFTGGKEVLLDTNLSEEQFGKSRFTDRMKENGILVKKDSEGKYTVFEKWYFTGTRSSSETVFFTADGFNGKPLLELNQSEDTETVKNLLSAIVESYSNALLNNISLPCVSPSGILYSDDQLLFAPENLLDSVCALKGQDFYKTYQAPWINKALYGKEKMRFTLGIYAYFALTGKLPFNPSSENGELSVYFANFMPLEFCINGIDRKLASSIDVFLSLSSEKKSKKGKKSDFSLETFREELYGKAQHENLLSEEDFKKKGGKYLKKVHGKMSRRFFMNKWRLTITFSAALILIVLLCANGIFQEQNKKPTVRGLTSEKTVQIFYAGIHKMDTDYILAAGKNCLQAQSYISQIPQIYITNQIRSAYNMKAGINTLESWLFLEPDSTKAYSHAIFGITDFRINGKKMSMNIAAPEKRYNRFRLSEENDRKIKPYDEKTYTVSYNLVHTVDNQIQIEKTETTVHLLFEAESWQITELKENRKISTESLLDFSLALKKALEHTEGNVPEAAGILRKKYFWIPDSDAMNYEQNLYDKTGW